MPIDTKTKECQYNFGNDCQIDIGSRSGKLWIVQHVFTVKHMMKILHICFGHAVIQNSFGRISLAFVVGI